MVGNTSGLATNVSLHKSLPYDPVKDFAPIALIARIPEVLVVNAALPVHSLADLARLAQGDARRPDLRLGRRRHRAASQRRAARRACSASTLTHVPYKGMSPAINDVAGGHIPFMFSPIPFAQPLAQAGKLRMLGVTTAERIEAIPDVPPLTEIGVKDFDAVSWFMLVAPAGTPRRHRRQAVTARSGPSSATRRCGRSSPGSAFCRCSRRRRTSSGALLRPKSCAGAISCRRPGWRDRNRAGPKTRALVRARSFR